MLPLSLSFPAFSFSAFFGRATMVVAASAALLGLSVASHAQDIDYGSLAELFGEPVTTSATGKPQRASEAPGSMIIIDQATIRRSAANTIPEILRNYAGMEVSQHGADSYDVGVRGGNLNYYPLLLVLVNGRQVYVDHFGFIVWSMIPVELSEIQQIEVVKGPNGALFGFNAVVGVINIVTKNPLYDDQIVVHAEAGLDDEYRVNASIVKPLGDGAGIRISGGYEEQDQFFTRFDTPLTRDPLRGSISGEGKFRIGDSGILSVEGSYAESNNFTFSQGASTLYRYMDTTSLGARYNQDSSIGILEGYVYYNWLFQENDLSVNGQSDLTFENEVLVAKLQDIITVNEKNTARLAVEYRHNRYFSEANVSGEINFDLFSASGMWENKSIDNLTLMGAVRVDYVELGQSGPVSTVLPYTAEDFNRSLTEISFNANANYTMGEIGTLKFGVARAVQLPSLLNLGLGFDLGAVVFAGDPDTPVSPVWNYEIGFVRGIESLNATFSTAVFYRDIEDQSLFPFRVTLTPPDVPVPTQQVENIGGFESYGFEVSLDGRTESGVTWGVNYTYTDVNEELPGAGIGGIIAIPVVFEDQTPKHKASVRLGYESGPFTIDVYARYRGVTGDIRPPRSDGRFRVQEFERNFSFDARAAYRFNDGLEVYAIGENISDTADLGSSLVRTESRARIGVRVEF